MVNASPKKNKNVSQLTCESLARSLFCADILNLDYVSLNTITKAMGARSNNAATRLLRKLGYEHQPYEDAKSLEERAEILYQTLKVFQMEGLKAYIKLLKTKEGKEEQKARLVRRKFPEGYRTRKKLEAEEEQETIRKHQERMQNKFDEWSD